MKVKDLCYPSAKVQKIIAVSKVFPYGVMLIFVNLTFPLPKWGIYGEYVGNLGWGSPSPNPFVHRRSGRFVGNLRKNAFS